MSNPLFNEFSGVSAKQWKQKIQFDLKGADYNETLITRTLEGIDIKPFYHSEEVDPLAVAISNTPWKVAQRIEVTDEVTANKKALNAIKDGVEALDFIINSPTINLQTLLENIATEKIQLYFSPQFLSVAFVQQLNEVASAKNSTVFCDQDFIAQLARTGNWYENLEKDHAKLASISQLSLKNVSVISVDSTLYQNAGANAVQQLAYALSHANEYLNFLEKNERLDILQNNPLRFKVAVGNDYFMEIAKLRALRILYKTLAEAYHIPTNCYILAEPSKRNKTIYDYNLNMLRTTTECMSSVLGGADAICNLPYDSLYHPSNEFGDRIAKNQLLILKHESYFDKVANPADGAYYIEELTRQLAQKALSLFKQIEEGGGFLNQLKEHNIQRKIKENAALEQELFDSGKRVLVGTNKYENPQDQMKDSLEKSPFPEKKSRKTIIEPILEKRLAENWEQQRLAKEK
ncbi:methylmalonyl-CoA mutase subunit beta [Ascidiimonas sp. W6]|uniref:methylmalonyl-CoA mutase subunit beta n=1 Tax=Ascidiimonas meishanensis TaxID=3128903 RepID=UPI0030EC182B